MKAFLHVDAPKMRGAPCFVLLIEDGRVVEAPPIARWTVGKSVVVVERWYQERGAQTSFVQREGA